MGKRQEYTEKYKFECLQFFLHNFCCLMHLKVSTKCKGKASSRGKQLLNTFGCAKC